MTHTDFIEKNGEKTHVIVRHELPRDFIMLRRIIYYVLDVLEFLLLGRFVLKLLQANPAGGFTNFIYSFTGPLVAPFRGIIATFAVEGLVFEWSTLLAMMVYAILAYLLIRLLRLSFIR